MRWSLLPWKRTLAPLPSIISFKSFSSSLALLPLPSFPLLGLPIILSFSWCCVDPCLIFLNELRFGLPLKTALLSFCMTRRGKRSKRGKRPKRRNRRRRNQRRMMAAFLWRHVHKGLFCLLTTLPLTASHLMKGAFRAFLLIEGEIFSSLEFCSLLYDFLSSDEEEEI